MGMWDYPHQTQPFPVLVIHATLVTVVSRIMFLELGVSIVSLSRR